ncbi:MAG: CotH kinase family protein [Planctomycetes bacterium]|nr:CotH kinase family protein [Planctomycetota bacterium]
MKSLLLILTANLLLFCVQVPAQVLAPTPQEYLQWPKLFDADRILHLELDMAPGDWNTVQTDTSYAIEVPAMFGLAGEPRKLVSVRRKSCDSLQNGTSFAKVSLKIDINDLVQGQTWHNLKKLSLENGDDEDVVTEGLGWAIHRMAHAAEGYPYQPGYANWATVSVNGTYTGLYVNPEQKDKRFLKNRRIWSPGETWLYKLSDVYSDSLKAGNGESPDHAFFCYDPFQRPRGSCQTPDLATLEMDCISRINMQGMLTMGAVNAFLGHGDSLFSKGKNVYFADYLNGNKRLYLPWDLDSIMSQVNHNIFNPGDHYADEILAVPLFRNQYKSILIDLLDGPMQVYEIHAFLDQMEPILTPWLLLDANNQLGDANGIASKFQGLKDWVEQRDAIVRAQIAND